MNTYFKRFKFIDKGPQFRHFGMSAFTKDTKYNLPEMKEKKC